MNKMKEVAELLGVELEEEFEIEEIDNKYKITENGLLSKGSSDWFISHINILHLLTGEVKIKKQWKPKQDEAYYSIELSNKSLCEYSNWDDYWHENLLLERGLIFKTREEAIACAKRMLEVAKEERK